MRKDNDIPAELREQLAYEADNKDYSAKDLVLAYMADKGHPATTNELITYVWQVSGNIIKRTYLYQMLYRMRKAEQVVVGEPLKGVKRFEATEVGKREARAYITPVKK